MPGLVPGIHVLDVEGKTWMAGTSPAMTERVVMPESSWLWALFTVIAAASQTVRNATQRELTTTLGTAGATHVRFLFGLPFGALFLLAVVLASGQALPQPPAMFWPWVLAGIFFFSSRRRHTRWPRDWSSDVCSSD